MTQLRERQCSTFFELSPRLKKCGFKANGDFCVRNGGKKLTVAVEVDTFPSNEAAEDFLVRLAAIKNCVIYALPSEREVVVKKCKSFVLIRGGDKSGVCYSEPVAGKVHVCFSVKNGGGKVEAGEHVYRVASLLGNESTIINAVPSGIEYKFYTQEEAERIALKLTEASNIVDDATGTYTMLTVEKMAHPIKTTTFSLEVLRYLGFEEVNIFDASPCYITADAIEKCIISAGHDFSFDAFAEYAEVING